MDAGREASYQVQNTRKTDREKGKQFGSEACTAACTGDSESRRGKRKENQNSEPYHSICHRRRTGKERAALDVLWDSVPGTGAGMRSLQSRNQDVQMLTGFSPKPLCLIREADQKRERKTSLHRNLVNVENRFLRRKR